MADNPQQATKTTAIDSGNSKGVATDDRLCLKCHEKPMTYECDPCGCHAFCTGCARKLASGGKCKVCGNFYGGLRRLRSD